MAEDVLGQIAQAKDFAMTLMTRVDQHIQRVLNAIPKPLGEFALELGVEDRLNGIGAGMGCTVSCPWHADVFSLRAWTDNGTPVIVDPITGLISLGPPPLIVPSIDLTFTLARQGSPYVRIPMSPLPFTVSGDIEIADTTTLSETNLSGGINAPTPLVNLLTLTGFTTELFPGDKIFADFSTVLGIPYLLGIELKCRLRAS